VRLRRWVIFSRLSAPGSPPWTIDVKSPLRHFQTSRMRAGGGPGQFHTTANGLSYLYAYVHPI